MRPTLSALALFLASVPCAYASPFTLLVFESPGELAKRTDAGDAGRAYWAAYADYGRRLTEAGVLRGGAPLAPEQRVAVGKASLGGYFVVDTASVEEAERWAAAAPAATTGGRVLVTPVVASPAMPAR